MVCSSTSEIASATDLCATELMASAGYEQPDAGSANETSKYRQLMRLPTVHLTALFCFIYVGTEVTLGGEFITRWYGVVILN